MIDKTKIYLRHHFDYLAFHIFSCLPQFLKHFISQRYFKPIFHQGSTIFGFTMFGPNVEIGDYSYLHSPIRLANIKIGKFCSIAQNFAAITHQHNFQNFFNYKFNNEINSPFTTKHYKSTQKVNTTKPIIIGNDVYIGYGVTILGGVTIGDGAIIAAGSVVTSNIPSHTIYGGVPAKLIKTKTITDKQIREFNFNNPNYLQQIDKILSRYDQ